MELIQVISAEKRPHAALEDGEWNTKVRHEDQEGFELLIGLSLAAQIHANGSSRETLFKRTRLQEPIVPTPHDKEDPSGTFDDSSDSKQEEEEEDADDDEKDYFHLSEEGEEEEEEEEEDEEAVQFLQGKINPTEKEEWALHYNKLKEFKENTGHLEVSTKMDRSLVAWIKFQRKESSRNRLSQEQIQLLKQIGFQWNSPRGSRHSWEDKFQKLKEFQELHGHCKVPLKLDRQLNSWVDAQRQANKQGRLSEERIKKLESLGVQWIVKSWESKFKKLKEFKERHGHCNVPLHTEKQLYRWVVDQRRAHKRGKLSAERVKKLEELGIRLTSKKEAKLKMEINRM